jgi:hypothetical protein
VPGGSGIRASLVGPILYPQTAAQSRRFFGRLVEEMREDFLLAQGPISGLAAVQPIGIGFKGGQNARSALFKVVPQY